MLCSDPEAPTEESINVFCRFRPLNQLEIANSGSAICIELLDGGTTVRVPSAELTFVLDKVFGCNASQNEVYEHAAKPIIQAVLTGFNGTVFAYGQTGSGKTYTMEGVDNEDPAQRGVIPRMVWSIFDGIRGANTNVEFSVKLSMMEIYNERIRDLLDPQKDNLKIHEDRIRGVYTADLTEIHVGSEAEICEITASGHVNRSMAGTNMNEHSSRSHMILTLTVEQKNKEDASIKIGKLHLVDLAGSEKVSKTGACGDRLDEAKSINRSLSALGNVIYALTDKKYTHVPYRDSKLTRVLQESLGGNAKTSLIIACSPSFYNEQETVSTLRFGQRAKMITNSARINRERSVEELKRLLQKKDMLLTEAHARIAFLEQTLRVHNIPIPDEFHMQEEEDSISIDKTEQCLMSELQDQLEGKKRELKESAEQISELQFNCDRLTKEVQTFDEKVLRLQKEIQDLTNEREKQEFMCQERGEEAAKLMRDNEVLQEEIKNLQSRQQQLQTPPQAMRPWRSDQLLDQSIPLDHKLVGSAPGYLGQSGSAEVRSSLRSKEKENTSLKKNIPKTGKNTNVEKLTVMSQKLIAENEHLKVELSENDMKIQRKDHIIAELERKLREAKQMYDKLLSHFGNLTDAFNMTTINSGNRRDRSSSNVGISLRQRNIRRPIRGGASHRHHVPEVY